MTSKRALLVGINYRKSSNELHGCINDVLNVKNVLMKKYGYEENNILLLTDDTVHKPTNANIIAGWQWLVSQTSAADFKIKNEPLNPSEKYNFVFHYSGHGSQVSDRNKEEADGKDETICPIDFKTAGMITDDFIRSKLVEVIPLNCKLTCIIDACHSESSMDLLWTCKTSTIGKFNLAKVGSYTATSADVCMISGCKDDQTSADANIGGKAQGALTYAFLKSLEKNNYNISYEKLLSDILYCLKNEKISSQIPCLSFGKSANISDIFTL